MPKPVSLTFPPCGRLRSAARCGALSMLLALGLPGQRLLAMDRLPWVNLGRQDVYLEAADITYDASKGKFSIASLDTSTSDPIAFLVTPKALTGTHPLLWRKDYVWEKATGSLGKKLYVNYTRVGDIYSQVLLLRKTPDGVPVKLVLSAASKSEPVTIRIPPPGQKDAEEYKALAAKIRLHTLADKTSKGENQYLEVNFD